MCAFVIAPSPELQQSGVRSQSCFVSPSYSLSSERVRVSLYPACKGLGPLGRRWYRGHHRSFRIHEKAVSDSLRLQKKTGFEIRGSSLSSNNESFDELLDPALGSGEGEDFVGSLELRRKQDLARLSAEEPLGAVRPAGNGAVGRTAEVRVSDDESDSEDEGNGSAVQTNSGDSSLSKEAAVAGERVGSAEAVVGGDERHAGPKKAAMKAAKVSGVSNSSAGGGFFKSAWDSLKDNAVIQFGNIWPAWQQKKRLERMLAQAVSHPNDLAKQAALLAELYKQSPQAVIQRFERREHATDSQAVVEYLRALIATNAITEFLADERTGRTSGLPALFSGLFSQGWNSQLSSDFDNEPDVNEHRSKSGSLASTPETTHGKLNGHRIDSVHTAAQGVDIAELGSLLSSDRDEFVSPDITPTLDNAPSTLNPNSGSSTSAGKVNGTLSSLVTDREGNSAIKDDANLSNDVRSNGALNGSSKSRPEALRVAVESLLLDDSVEESRAAADEERTGDSLVDENVGNITAHGVRINDNVQLSPGQDRTKIDEKRAEIADIISAISHRDIEGFSGKVNGRKQPISLSGSAESSASEITSSTELKKEKLRTSGWSSSRCPQSLSEVLPLKVSAGRAFYLKIYEKLLRAGRTQDCIALLEEMDKLKILDSDKIYHSKFFKECQRQISVSEAFRFMRLLSRPTLSSYNMLLCVCRDARDVAGGLRVLSAIENAGMKPDAILYTTLIATCAKAGKVDIAFKVYHDMETAGLTPTIRTYHAMIDGCALAGQIAKAFGVYGIMISKKLKPDHVIFNTLINACGRAGAIERAFDVLADMRGEPFHLNPDHVTIGALISACARAGQVDRALEVYKNMRKWGIKGTPECYTAAVHACSTTGNLDLALSVFEDMKRDGVKPDEIFFSALIDVAGHSQQVDAAFNILDEMKTVTVIPGAVTFSALMGVCCNTGNWERGLELYRKVRANNFRPTVSTFNALITALCDAKQIEQSFSVFQEMKEAGVQPDQITYSILLNACEKLDEPERAFDLYTSGRAEGIVPNEAMCASVIEICYARIKKKHRSSSYPCSIGLLSGQSNEAPYEQWASWAVAVYRHAVAANVVPTIKSLSLLLGCLRIPEASHERTYLSDDTFGHAGHFRFHSLSILEGAGFYDPRAFILFEEAASKGVVPRLNYKAGPITVNAQCMPSYVAEVLVITLLNGLKQRHIDEQQLFPVTIYYSTETKQRVTALKKLREIRISGRTGQGVAALLRRLRLHFHGHESSGKLRVDTAAIRKWLKPPATFPSLQRHQELGPFDAPHTFLTPGIAEQQRNIRMAEVYKNSPDIERVSGIDMYRNRRRISQGNSRNRGDSNDFDFTDNVNRSKQRASRKGTPDKRRP